jgi:hypothetical protein
MKLQESFAPTSRAEAGGIERHFHVSDEDPNILASMRTGRLEPPSLSI